MVSLMDQLLFKHFGFRLSIEELPPGLEGLTDCGSRVVTLPPHVYEGLEATDGRSRFTAAHEFGHVVLHAAQLAPTNTRFQSGTVDAPLLARRSQLKPFRDPEWQADTFAAALLMPRAMVRIIFDATQPTTRIVRLIAQQFEVSREAAKLRLQKLELLAEQPRLSTTW
jgi:Zn-dependent peptidase ImmA (M78 family)